MRTYEEIVLNAAEIAIEENGGRINCFEIEDFKAFTKTLEGAGYFWEMDASTDWIIIEKATGQEDIMKRLAQITTNLGLTDIYYENGTLTAVYPTGQKEEMDETAETEEEAIEMLIAMYGIQAEPWNMELV